VQARPWRKPWGVACGRPAATRAGRKVRLRQLIGCIGVPTADWKIGSASAA
jgi:hypothetical protein